VIDTRKKEKLEKLLLSRGGVGKLLHSALSSLAKKEGKGKVDDHVTKRMGNIV